MFGEYAQIATFLSPRDGNGNLYGMDAMPEYLRPPYQPSAPWGGSKTGLTEDFIMLAEFSELEGPKPLMSIPKDGGGQGFDQNSFAVRILAVDHQTSSPGFSIPEDAQVVLSDLDDGVFAFVHHLVLYDNTARGFVRPHCMAYITTDQRKLMLCYEEMSSQFKKAAHYIKYGNLLVFVGDLERHLKDLEHTKGFLLNQVSKQRLKDSENNSDLRKNSDNELHRKLQSIHQSSSEIKDILSILKPLLSDKRLEARFRALEEKAFQSGSSIGGDKLSLQENWFNDLSSLDGLDIRCGSFNESQLSPLTLFKAKDYKPLLVETKKARRFNTPLRGLHELCSWGAKEGLKKMRSLHEYFKRDIFVLELEKMESKLMKPSCASICHGQCVTGNFLAGVHMHQPSDPDGDDYDSTLRHSMWPSSFSLDSNDSFKSADSFLMARSPGSGNTNDSINGNLFSSPLSSLDKLEADICLSVEDEYYSQPCQDAMMYKQEGDNGDDDVEDEGLEAGKEGDDEEDDLTPGVGRHSTDLFVVADPCPQLQAGRRSRVEKEEEGSIMDQIKRIVDNFQDGEVEEEEEEPPLIVFREKIQRPLSIVSLGCTDDENDFDLNRSFDGGRTVDNGRCGVSNVTLNSDDVETAAELGDDDAVDDDKNGDKAQSLSTSRHPTEISESLPIPNGGPSHSSHSSHRGGGGRGGGHSHDSPRCASFTLPLVSHLSSSPFNNTPTPTPTTTTTSAINLSSRQETAVPVLDNPSAHHVLHTTTTPPAAPTTTKTANKSLPLPSSSSLSSVSSFSKQGGCGGGWDIPSLSSSPASMFRQNSSFSSYTDISIRDYFPYLADSECSTSVPLDVQSMSSTDALLHRQESTNNCSEGYPSHTKVTAPWRPRHGLYTMGDWLNTLTPGRPGLGILEVLNGYSNLRHVVYSLMIGRPVLVVGVAKMEGEVTKIVNALSVFVPSTKSRQQTCIVPWITKALRVSDLSKICLVGLRRPDRKSLESFIPSAVKKASTIMDVERRTIHAPHYQGQLIPSLLSKKKILKSDQVMLSYIQWWTMDLLGKAFIFFHSFYLGSAGSMPSSTNLREHRDSYRATVNGILGRLAIKDSDCLIVEHLAELAKTAYLEPSMAQNTQAGSVPSPVTVHYATCQTFKC